MADPQPLALVVGLDGATPADRTRGLVARLTRTLRDLLHPDFRAAVLGGAVVEGAALLDGLKPWKTAALGVWLVGIGRVERDEDDELVLCTTERQGLSVDKVRKRVAGSAAPWRVVVLDVPAEQAEALRALDWGRCAVLAIGPEVGEKLEAALLPDRVGDVTADDLARALDGKSNVSARINRRVGDAPKADPHAEAIEAYRIGVKRESERLVFDAATRDAGNVCTLSQVYVQLYAGGDRRTAFDRLAGGRCLFLVGEPGAGKTSFLRHVAGALCDAARDGARLIGLPADPLPVLFELASFRDEPTAAELLAQATRALPLADRGTDTLPQAAIDQALSTGRLVLLFDGLDEVPALQATPADRRRLQVAKALAELASRQAGNLKMVVTCRPAAAQDGAFPGPPFQRFDLQPMEDEQVFEVARNWLRSRPATADRAEHLARDLIADLATHPAVQELARNPLTLAMICVLLYEKAHLPRDRNDLYSQLIDLLLRNREKDRDPATQPDLAPLRRVELTDLAELWWRRGGTQEAETLLSEEEMAQELAHRRALTLSDARKEVRFFDEKAGLLVWRGTDNSHRLLRFAHRSFAEYLKACRLTEDAQQTELVTHALDANWREVALMYVAEHARKPTGDKEPAWRFLRTLLDRAEDERHSTAERGAAARLAAQCLVGWRDEPAAQVEPDLGQRLDTLQDLFLHREHSRRIAVADRVEFWTAVGPHNRVVQEQHRWVEVPAGQYWFGAAPGDRDAARDEQPARPVKLSAFRIHRWPVTVAELGEFIADGGYHRRDLWSAEGWALRERERRQTPGRWPRPGELHHPITDVSWFEAEAFCAWLTLRTSGWQVTLPTEAQWEAAARGPYLPHRPVVRYPWGMDDDPDCRAGAGSWDRGPVPPGAFPRGAPTGTWDQSGNVWEWCRDGLAGSLAVGGHDPDRPAEPGESRVLRGGAFHFGPHYLRVSYRLGYAPRGRSGSIGFRCVCRRPPDP